MQIYRTIKGLGEPIGPEISRVFDRMLTEPERPTIVAPTREPGTSLADVHETDAMATPAYEAVPAADRVIAKESGAKRKRRFKVSVRDRRIEHREQEWRAEPAAETGLRPGEEGSVSNAGVDAGNEPAGGSQAPRISRGAFRRRRTCTRGGWPGSRGDRNSRPTTAFWGRRWGFHHS